MNESISWLTERPDCISSRNERLLIVGHVGFLVLRGPFPEARVMRRHGRSRSRPPAAVDLDFRYPAGRINPWPSWTISSDTRDFSSRVTSAVICHPGDGTGQRHFMTEQDTCLIHWVLEDQVSAL